MSTGATGHYPMARVYMTMWSLELAHYLVQGIGYLTPLQNIPRHSNPGAQTTAIHTAKYNPGVPQDYS